MKFLVDINITKSVINELIKNEYDVLDIKKKQLDLKDTDLIKITKADKRIILNKDKDFIILTQFPKYQVPTIIVRLKKQTPKHLIKHIIQLLKNQKESILNRSLTIIREERASSHPY